MGRKTWRKDSESGYLSDKISLEMIKEAAQQVVRGECSYSAYMGNSVEDEQQEQNQEDSGDHDQDVTHEVENVGQSNGDEQRESTGSEKEEAQSSRDEQGEPASS
ncbi:hypothetical protein F2Q68_00039239 [Brassica cretica]|uniref:Uncharacterized protein n=1 Tax=Brassica cretica TaxID=69181 RepID=A0A8S9MLF7_BRACR|nr:hypothetical protein F2Q68_00039239 [Brassica cretica]